MFESRYENMGLVKFVFDTKNNCMLAMLSRTLNPSTKPSQIGIRSSGTRKCSQRFEINHFCQVIFQLFSLPKFFLNPVGELLVLPIQRPIYL